MSGDRDRVIMASVAGGVDYQFELMNVATTVNAVAETNGAAVQTGVAAAVAAAVIAVVLI